MSDLFPDAPKQVSLDRMIECVGRELLMRRRVYPRRVESGAMSQRQADDEIAIMEAVRDALQTRMLAAEGELERLRLLLQRTAGAYRVAAKAGAPSDPAVVAEILEAMMKAAGAK